MELIKWANGKGQTLKLTQRELEALYQLLRSGHQSYFVTQSIELNDGETYELEIVSE